MSEHTKTDGLSEAPTLPLAVAGEPVVLDKSRPRNERMAGDKIECNACPVLCQISPGKSGACDRYANANGVLIRVDPVVLLRRTLEQDDAGGFVVAAQSGGSRRPACHAADDQDLAHGTSFTMLIFNMVN